MDKCWVCAFYAHVACRNFCHAGETVEEIEHADNGEPLNCENFVSLGELDIEEAE